MREKIRLVVGGRRSGKTSALVREYFANPGSKIVATSASSRRNLRSFGVPDRDIISFDNMYHELRGSRGPLLVEDLDQLFIEYWYRILGDFADRISLATFDTSAMDEVFDTLDPERISGPQTPQEKSHALPRPTYTPIRTAFERSALRE